MNKNSFSDLEYLELLARRVAEGGIDMTANYGDWINVVMACASLGEQSREACHTICSQYPRYSREECDEKFNNCLSTGRGDITLGTLVKMCQDYGIDTSKPRGRRPKTSRQREEEQKNKMEAMRLQLTGFAAFRFNTLKQQVEVKEGNTDWRPIEDRDLQTYYCRIKEAGVNVRQQDVLSMIQNRDFSKEFNPLLEYLNALPPFNPDDGKNYIQDMFIGHLEFGDKENETFYDMVLQKWFVGMVALWLGKIDENPIMPVFCGPQHIGKTFFIRHILPPQLRSYRMEPAPSTPVDKDFIISTSEVPMIFLDEFSITSNTKSDAYKYLITSSQSNLRDAYGHFRQTRRRRASLIAATNLRHFIRDVEGNRRYAGIDLKDTVDLDNFPLPYDGAYAQALWLLNEKGVSPKPDHEESMLISEHNRSFMESNDCEEALRVFLRQPSKDNNPEALSAGDIMQELGNRGFHGRTFNAVEIGKAMKRMGFESIKAKGHTKYCVVIADYDQQKRERKEDALTVG